MIIPRRESGHCGLFGWVSSNPKKGTPELKKGKCRKKKPRGPGKEEIRDV